MPKMVYFLLLALFSLFVAGSPLGLNSTNTSLRWTGKVPGHGIMTFYGSIDNVRDQMFALNPSLRHNRVLNSPYNPYTGKNPRPLDETEMAVNKFAYTRKQGPFYLQPSSNNASLLQSRYGQADPSNHSSLQTSSANASLFLSSNDQTDVSKSLSTQPGSITWECGGFATGSYAEAFSAISKLYNTEGEIRIAAARKYGIGWATVPTCKRLACSQDSQGNPTHTAIYWCNNNLYPVYATADVLSSVATMVAEGYNLFGFYGCCIDSQKWGAHSQYSGQIYVGNGTNIVVAYGKCSETDYWDLPSDLPVPGPYGTCT